MRHEIVTRVFFLLSVVILGACFLFAWVVKA